jgi:hypothetical protein
VEKANYKTGKLVVLRQDISGTMRHGREKQEIQR